MSTFDITVAEYRYFVVDFLSNQVIAELPFKGVTYGRAIKAAGSFSGTIPIIDKTMAYDLYETTMPGKTALYVVRNDQCVWGGIIWSRSYSLDSRELSVSASEFTSYLHHRKIWKTYSHDFGATITSSSGSCTVQLNSGRFNFVSGMPIRIVFIDEALTTYNGYYTVGSSPTATSFSTVISGLPTGTYSGATVLVRVDTYDYVRQLLEEMLVDFSSINFANEIIEPAMKYTYSVTTKSLTDNVATLTIDSGHLVEAGPTITVTNVDSTFNGIYPVTAVTSNTVSYAKTAGNVSPTAVVTKTGTVTSRTHVEGADTAILQFSAPTTFAIGDVIVVTGVDDAGWSTPVYNGTHVVSYAANDFLTPGVHIVSFAADTTAPADVFTLCSGSATNEGGKVVYGTFGSFPANADFGLTFSTEEYSGEYISTLDKIRRGYELKSIGDELDEYSDTLRGFEYRIDCDYNTATSSFMRTFYMYPINVPDTDPPTPAGEPSAIERFGAQNYVFEYPGNIMNVTLDESAEHAATRFFMVGSGDGLGSDASQPYAAASAMTLLNEGWPILDADDNRTEDVNADGTKASVLDEERLYEYAQRYLAEFQPPVGDFKVTVNGSFAPVIGSYNPGDWCCLIIDDDFVRLRLASNLEPRDNVLVRKIDSYTVNVPDNPSFPEVVELNLITEWQVDTRG